MSAGKSAQLQIDTNADWIQVFQYLDVNQNPINLTGYTAELQMRSQPTDLTPVLSLTTVSGIVITPSTGLITCTAPLSTTSQLSAGYYQYDLVITSSTGGATALCYGTIFVREGISR